MQSRCYRSRESLFATTVTVAALALGFTQLTPARAAPTATITVTTTADELNSDGDCSLREAIRAANRNTQVDACPAGGVSDVIVLPGGTYTLTRAGKHEDGGRSGDLDITGNLEIRGAGADHTAIDGNRLDRVIEVHTGSNVQISGVTILGGYLESVQEFEERFIGGGILNHGTLQLTQSTVRDNTVVNPYFGGGGIWNAGTLKVVQSSIRHNTASAAFGGGGGMLNVGTATLSESTVSENVASDSVEFAGGGGLWNAGAMTLINSTVSNNISFGDGGGIRNGGSSGGFGIGPLTIINSTISGNSSAEHYEGGGIWNWGPLTLNNSTIARNVGGGIIDAFFQDEENQSPVLIANTILAGNTNVTGGALDCSGLLTSQGYNLIQTPDSCTIEGDLTGNLLGVDPRLGELGDYGGPTKTHVLESNSPAIDKGSPQNPGSGESACLLTDQRGVSRPRDGNGDGLARCDIGAVERKAQ